MIPPTGRFLKGFLMIRRPYRKQRDRSRLTPSAMPPGPFINPVVTLVATKARVTCSAPIVVRALPTEITRQAAGSGPQLLPTGYTIVDAQTVDLTYAASCVATDKITVPAGVQNVRGTSGGQLSPSVTTF
jgi:hypothetical protein